MAIYYISSSGSTSNNGTTPTTPWPLSKVASTAFVAGDNILFKKGDTFSGIIGTISRSGSAGNPIVLDLYGTAVHNPIFDAAAGTTPILTLSGSYITVRNLYLKNCTAVNGTLYITTGMHDITLYNVAINGGIRGIHCYHMGASGVVNLSVQRCWVYNIFDTLQASGDTAHGGGSPIQMNNCNGSGIEIAYNKFYTRDPDTANGNNYGVGDIISQYQCNGTAGSYILVHDNQIRGGGNNQVTGYIGITCGDVGGSYQHIYNNILVDSGQGGVGVMPSGAVNIIVESNRMYSKYTGNTSNYVGLTFNSVPGAANCIVQHNNVTWYATGKSGPYNKYSFQSPPPSGWSTNTADTAIDALATEIMLPNPLFNEYDWDTITGLISFTGQHLIQL